jgi:hypothetical protein
MATSFKGKRFLQGTVLAVLISITTISQAQKFYAVAGAGYAFSAPGNVLGSNFIPTGDSILSVDLENVYGTYGKGFNTGIGIGYMITDFIGIEVASSYLKSEKYELKSGDPRYPGLLYLTVLNAKMLRILAAVKITGGNKVKPYCRIGFIYGIGMQVTQDDVTWPDISSDKYYGGTAPGWLGAIGVDWALLKKLSFFCEGNFILQNYFPAKREIKNDLGTYSYDLVDKMNSANDTQRLKPSFPFSSIGINAGIKFSFGRKKKDI